MTGVPAADIRLALGAKALKEPDKTSLMQFTGLVEVEEE